MSSKVDFFKALSSMSRALAACVLLLLSLAVYPNDSIEREAIEWYRTVYFPPYEDSSKLNLDEVARHYYKNFRRHSDSGSATATFPTNDFAELIRSGIARGWTGDTLEDISGDVVNQSTVSLKVKVIGNMRDSENETYCFWYVLSRRGGSWAITNTASIDCSTIP